MAATILDGCEISGFTVYPGSCLTLYLQSHPLHSLSCSACYCSNTWINGGLKEFIFGLNTELQAAQHYISLEAQRSTGSELLSAFDKIKGKKETQTVPLLLPGCAWTTPLNHLHNPQYLTKQGQELL